MNEKHFILGGDIKKSLAEGYHFDIKSLFKDAFVITKKNYFPLAIASLTFVLMILAYMYFINSFAEDETTVQMILNYGIILLLFPPLLTALQMMGIHHSIGLKTKANHLFNCFNIILKLSLATMIISLISNAVTILLTKVLGDIGFALSILALIYMNMAFCLVNPLIAEKKLTPIMAVKFSFKLVNKNIIQFTLIYILVMLLFVVAIIPSGLGLFFVFPFYFNLMGIIYRHICGVSVVAIERAVTDNHNDHNDHNDHSGGFDA